MNRGELCFIFQSQVPAQNGSAFRKWDDDITSMTYEDILATAILNKVLRLEITIRRFCLLKEEQKTLKHFFLTRAMVFWNVTPCSLVHNYWF
jgi:hypothetical protein